MKRFFRSSPPSRSWPATTSRRRKLSLHAAPSARRAPPAAKARASIPGASASWKTSAPAETSSTSRPPNTSKHRKTPASGEQEHGPQDQEEEVGRGCAAATPVLGPAEGSSRGSFSGVGRAEIRGARAHVGGGRIRGRLWKAVLELGVEDAVTVQQDRQRFCLVGARIVREAGFDLERPCPRGAGNGPEVASRFAGLAAAQLDETLGSGPVQIEHVPPRLGRLREVDFDTLGYAWDQVRTWPAGAGSLTACPAEITVRDGALGAIRDSQDAQLGRQTGRGLDGELDVGSFGSASPNGFDVDDHGLAYRQSAREPNPRIESFVFDLVLDERSVRIPDPRRARRSQDSRRDGCQLSEIDLNRGRVGGHDPRPGMNESRPAEERRAGMGVRGRQSPDEDTENQPHDPHDPDVRAPR